MPDISELLFYLISAHPLSLYPGPEEFMAKNTHEELQV
jgi:hypothetical protein